MSKKKKLVILDAHALIHRAYHALPSFVSSSGEPMGAVYGVASVLLKLLRELEPTHVAAAFDREEPTFRHVAYDQYKSTREKTKDDLIPQFEKVKEMFRAFDIKSFDEAGLEADDIIGALVDRFRSEPDISIVIASGDMDTLQLVEGDKVLVYTMRKGLDDTILYDQKKVEERFGFSPRFIPDYKGLKGDPSDNIIGVKGIGDKTASALIQQYHTLENVYEKLKGNGKKPTWLKERIQNLLIENEEEAFFSKELATIRKDARSIPKLPDIQWKGLPFEKAAQFLRKCHFPSLVLRLEKQSKDRAVSKKEKISSELTPKIWSTIEKAAEITCVLTENHIEIALSNETYNIPLPINDDIRAHLRNVFSDEKKVYVDDAKKLYYALGFMFPVSFDLSIARWLKDPGEFHGPTQEKNVSDLCRRYATELKRSKLEEIYYSLELPLTPTLYYMERLGIGLDTKALERLHAEIETELKLLKKEITQQAGEAFDINSPKQLSHILFDVMKLPKKGIRKTSTRAVSTQFSELLKLRGKHPIIENIIRHREISKIDSTYVRTLPGLVDQNDGRIHTTFNQTGTSTGRLSSIEPNMQNIPIRTELGKKVRRAFIADDDFEFVSFDYAHFELRIAAALSRDKSLLSIFREGHDVHEGTARRMFGLNSREPVTKEMRRRAKVINFGILYGMGARALSQGMGTSEEEAKKYLGDYRREFRGIEEYRIRVTEEGRKNGYVETLFGRRRYLPNLRSRFEFVRKEAERMAINMPIQGTEADLIKRAMIEIARIHDFSDAHGGVKMLLQVHDELLFEIKSDIIDKTIPGIRAIMEHAPELNVPIIVEVKRGKNWQDMKPISSVI